MAQSTSPQASQNVPSELSPEAQDTSRAVTGTAQNTPNPELADPARNREQRVRRLEGRQNENPDEAQEENGAGQMFGENLQLEGPAMRGITYKPVPEINRTQASIIDRMKQETIKEIPTDRHIKVAIAFHEQVGRIFDVTA